MIFSPDEIAVKNNELRIYWLLKKEASELLRSEPSSERIAEIVDEFECMILRTQWDDLRKRCQTAVTNIKGAMHERSSKLQRLK